MFRCSVYNNQLIFLLIAYIIARITIMRINVSYVAFRLLIDSGFHCKSGWDNRILLKKHDLIYSVSRGRFSLLIRQSRALVRCKNAAQKRNSRVRWKSVVFCNTGMTRSYPLGDYTLPRGTLVLRRENYARHPGVDVRAISEVLRRDSPERREKAYRERAGIAPRERPRTYAFRSRARTAERWKGCGSDDTRDGDEILSTGMYAVRLARMYVIRRAYFISTAGALLFPPERRRNPRALALALARGGSRIIKDGLTIFPRVPGGRGQCDGALRGICRCTRCCVCFY